MNTRRAKLKAAVIEAVDPVEFYQEYYPDWSGKENDLVECPRGDNHEGGDDSTASLCLNPESGAFKCYGCSFKGTSIVGYAAFIEGDYGTAVTRLFADHVRATISPSVVSEYRKAVRKVSRRLLAKRGWSAGTLKKFRIGWCEKQKRTVFPIYNLEGMCIDLRFHDSLELAKKSKKGKRIAMKAPPGGKTGDLWPLQPNYNPFEEDTIWIFEGEPDTLLAIQEGFNAVTITGGAGTWDLVDFEVYKSFQNKHIVVCLDNDKPGQKAALALVARLAAMDIKSVKNVTVPKGKDFSEYMLRHVGDADTLRGMANLAEPIFKAKKRERVAVPLGETSEAKYIGMEVMTDVLVNGKYDSPISVPRRLRYSCRTGERCAICPCSSGGTGEHFVLSEDPAILDWVRSKDYSKTLRSELNLPNNCPMIAEVVEWQSLRPVSMIPAPSTRTSRNSYARRQGYYLGHDLESNRHYHIRAIPTVHPSTKESVLLVAEAKGTHDAIDDYQLSREEVKELKGIFNGKPKTIIREIAEVLSRNHTRIYGRWDLHAAVDIAFHSPREFVFANTPVPKGSIELVVFGDETQGKGQVAEGLVRLYDLGAVVSGENASFMGLVGGAQKTDRGFDLVWGRIPTNHGRLVVIDEFSGFSDMGRLSRIRSEGIAELDKGGIHSRTEANTRLVWIANCRKGRAITDFPSGIEALLDLVGAHEDVRRFDLCVAVAKGEVSIEEINRNDRGPIKSRYTRAALRKVVLWAWSRSRDEVRFSVRATERIFAEANRLAERYSGSIPLIQGENARFKIAKVAAAIAARCFSTDKGKYLLVEEDHARCAVSFIKRLYDKPVMGYLGFSEIERGGSVLRNVEELDKLIDSKRKELRPIFVDGMLRAETFGVREVQDWLGVDGTLAKRTVGTLVRCQAIYPTSHGQYKKRASFSYWLNKKKRKLSGSRKAKRTTRRKGN